VRTSDAPCRATSPRVRAPNPRLEGPRGASCLAPYECAARRTRRARSAGTAAGLGRRTPNGPERLPSDRPGPRGPSGLVALVVHVHGFAPHPVACHEPDPPRQRLEGRFRLPHLGPTHPGLPQGSPAKRERCVSPTSATNLRHEHPTDCPIPELAAGSASLRSRLRHAPTRPRPKTSDEPSGGASLDGEPPASALPQRASRLFSGRLRTRLEPWPQCRRDRARRDPGGASIECSFARRFPAAAFSAARRACSVASDVLCRGPVTNRIRPCSRACPTKPPGSAPAAASSKTTASSKPGRLPSTSAISPAPAPPCPQLAPRARPPRPRLAPPSLDP